MGQHGLTCMPCTCTIIMQVHSQATEAQLGTTGACVWSGRVHMFLLCPLSDGTATHHPVQQHMFDYLYKCVVQCVDVATHHWACASRHALAAPWFTAAAAAVAVLPFAQHHHDVVIRPGLSSMGSWAMPPTLWARMQDGQVGPWSYMLLNWH